MSKFSNDIAKAGAMINAIASQIFNSDLPEGEKFLELQQLMLELTPTIKKYEKQKDTIAKWAKSELIDYGDGKSQLVDYEGAEVYVKYSYAKPTLDTDKIVEDYTRILGDYNQEFNPEKYYKPSTPRQTVVIQSKIN